MPKKQAEVPPQKGAKKDPKEDQLKLLLRGDRRVPKMDEEGRVDRLGPEDLGEDE